jgi:L-galactono-1,4-lactone dehydrogenase
VVFVRSFFEPRCVSDVVNVLRTHGDGCSTVRCMGSNMSPNGISATCADVVLSMSKMDRVLSVCKERQLVTVEPGVRIENLLDALDEHGLTVRNLPSTIGMQMGGLVQTGAHGSGIRLPPVNELVEEVALLTYAPRSSFKNNNSARANDESDFHEVVLRGDDDADASFAFDQAKCCLGTMGVVTRLTLRCSPAHFLVARREVLPFDEVRRTHAERMDTFARVVYHHIPFTGKTVVYTFEERTDALVTTEEDSRKYWGNVPESKKALVDLLKTCIEEKRGEKVNENQLINLACCRAQINRFR